MARSQAVLESASVLEFYKYNDQHVRRRSETGKVLLRQRLRDARVSLFRRNQRRLFSSRSGVDGGSLTVTVGHQLLTSLSNASVWCTEDNESIGGVLTEGTHFVPRFGPEWSGAESQRQHQSRLCGTVDVGHPWPTSTLSLLALPTSMCLCAQRRLSFHSSEREHVPTRVHSHPIGAALRPISARSFV